MRGRHDGSYSRAGFGNSRESDALGKHPVGKQLVGKVHCQVALADNDGSNRRFTLTRVKPQPLESGLKESRVFPETLDPLRLVLKHLERFQTRCRDSGRM